MSLLKQDVSIQATTKATRYAILAFVVSVIMMLFATLASNASGANSTTLLAWIIATPVVSWAIASQVYTCVIITVETKKNKTRSRAIKR